MRFKIVLTIIYESLQGGFMTIKLKKITIAIVALICINSAVAASSWWYVKTSNPLCSDNTDAITSIIQLEDNKVFGVLFEINSLLMGLHEIDIYTCIGRKEVNNITWYKTSTISEVEYIQDSIDLGYGLPIISKTTQKHMSKYNQMVNVAYIGNNAILVVFPPDKTGRFLDSVMGIIDNTTDKITWGEPTEIARGIHPEIKVLENNLVEVSYDQPWSENLISRIKGEVDLEAKAIAWRLQYEVKDDHTK